MSRLAPSLPDDRIAAASDRAEGWAAGLQLAALAARSEGAQQGFEVPVTAGDLLVQDYILREVLAPETPEMIQTLSKVAVVDRVNPSLAEALTGSGDAGMRLAQAEERGLFITRLGPERWSASVAMLATCSSSRTVTAPPLSRARTARSRMRNSVIR